MGDPGGELEMTIEGLVEIAGPGMVAIVPANVTHSVRALSNGKAVVIDYPLAPTCCVRD
jgi:quercetin dioxygenase-like cupin family protein